MEPLPQPVEQCLEILRRAGYEAYPVGGCVRDLLLGRTPGDWDVATSAAPDVSMKLLHAWPSGIKYGTVTAHLPHMAMEVEVTTFRSDGAYIDGRHPGTVAFGTSLTEDLARRDFTINAMALAPDGSVIDPFGGQADLKRKVITCVGEPARRFTEDALRMFRAVRFAAQLGFTIHPDTLAAIPPLAHRVSLVTKERIYAEVEKILRSPNPDRAALLWELGLLDVPRRADLSSLRALPTWPDSVPRWQEFCRLTGFDVTSLPVPRGVRLGVLHPERRQIARLALSGGALRDMGFAGPAIGKAQLALARHVAEHPEDNDPAALRALALRLTPEDLGD